MKIIPGNQTAEVEDLVRAKLAIVVPVLKATLHSLARDRIERLGGITSITLHDLAREVREGHGDAGICFEYAVHDAIATNHPLIADLASEVLKSHCRIHGGAESILFGPEKEGVIPILESVEQALTDESVVYVGNRGRPPKLKRYIPKIINAYRRNEARNKLPRAISGIWKADLFLGNHQADAWVGTTIKINPAHLQAAEGLRIGIYPKANDRDVPRLDGKLNLIRLPLPYDGQFMEIFYKSFYLARAFLRADARVPQPVELPDAEDRFICRELESRREFAVHKVIAAVTEMSQKDLIEDSDLRDEPVNAFLSEERGLQTGIEFEPTSDAVSITPIPREER
jgi:hypothetical protein